MLDGKFRSDAVFAYAVQAAAIALGFAFMALVTRYGDLGTYGALAILTALSAILNNLITFRTNEAVVAFYRQGEAKGQPGRVKLALFVGAGIDLGVGATALALVYGLAPTIAAQIVKDPAATGDVRLFAVTLFFSFLRGTPMGYLQARERFRQVNLLTLGDHIGKACVLAAFVVAKDTITLTHAVVANVAAAATVTILAYGPLLTVLGGRLRTVAMHLDRRTVGEFARFNVTTFFSSALKAGSRNVDTLVLGYVTTPAVVGLYSLFRQFLAPLPFASAPIATLTYPKFVQAVIERRHADARQAIAAVNRKLSLVYATLLLLVGPALLGYLYWMHIGVGTPELLALAMMALTAYLSGRLWWARPYANAVDPVISLRANLYATLAILVLLYPLTSALGMAGTALCMLSQAVLLVIYFRKLLSHAPPARREHGT